MGLVRTFVFSVMGVMLYGVFFILAVIIVGHITDFQWNGIDVASVFIIPLIPLGIILYEVAMYFNPPVGYAEDNIYTRARDKAHRKAEEYREKAGYYYDETQNNGNEEEQEKAYEYSGEADKEREERERQEESAKEEAYQKGKAEGERAGQRSGKMTREEAYEYLGLTPKATKEQVKQAYRKLSKVIHPDASGVNTNAFMKKLNEAWEEIKKERGF